MTVFAWCAPEKDLWPFWETHDENAKIKIDHSPYDKWLQKFVKMHNGQSYVDYAKVNLKARNYLKSYVLQMQTIKIRQYNRLQQEAYWINLYNARTILLILEKYPVQSIRDITFRVALFSKILRSGPWHHPLLKVEGKGLTLNDIEHRILRPIYEDPRLHYLLNCAAISCPNLQNHAITVANLEEMLNQAAVQFINSPKGVTINEHLLEVSRIYSWYKKDFGGMDRAVITHLRQYAKPELKKHLGKFTTLRYLGYNWELNDFVIIENKKAMQIKKQKAKEERERLKRERRLKLKQQREQRRLQREKELLELEQATTDERI